MTVNYKVQRKVVYATDAGSLKRVTRFYVANSTSGELIEGPYKTKKLAEAKLEDMESQKVES